MHRTSCQVMRGPGLVIPGRALVVDVKRNPVRTAPGKPSPYSVFVRDHYRDADIASLPSTERFAALGRKWQEQKAAA